MQCRQSFWQRRNYDTIAGLGTVTEAIEYLKDKTAYAPYVNRMDISLYHRGNVEKILYQSLFDDYSRLFRFAGMKQKTFLKLYWKRYEIDLINYCLRIVFNHYDKPFDLEYKKEFFDRYSQISIDRLITSKNIDELVDNLRIRSIMMHLPELKIPERERFLIMIWHWICIIFPPCGKREKGF